MAPIATALRRALFLLLLAAGIGAAVSSRRARSATPTPAAPPQWPQWPERPERPETLERAQAVEPPLEPLEPRSAVRVAPASESASASASEQTWVPAHRDGTAPESHPIKVKLSSGIFHVPGGRFYDRTRADRCYPTAAAAEADGYRRSKT